MIIITNSVQRVMYEFNNIVSIAYKKTLYFVSINLIPGQVAYRINTVIIDIRNKLSWNLRLQIQQNIIE